MVSGLGATAGATWAQGDFNDDGNVNVLRDAFTLVGQLGQSVVPPAGFLSRTANTESLLTSSAESIAVNPVVIADLDRNAQDDEDELAAKSESIANTELSLAGSQELDSAFESTLLIDDLL